MHECVPHMSQHLQIPLKLVPNASPSPVLLKRFLRTDITLPRDLLNRGNEKRGRLGQTLGQHKLLIMAHDDAKKMVQNTQTHWIFILGIALHQK